MNIFAIACLISILITVQHLLNWAIRGIWAEKNDNNGFPTFLFIVLSAIITFFAGKYLILWTYPFLN